METKLLKEKQRATVSTKNYCCGFDTPEFSQVLCSLNAGLLKFPQM